MKRPTIGHIFKLKGWKLLKLYQIQNGFKFFQTNLTIINPNWYLQVNPIVKTGVSQTNGTNGTTVASVTNVTKTSNLTIQVTTPTPPVNRTGNVTSPPVLTTLLPKINVTTPAPNATNFTEKVPVSEGKDNSTKFAEAIIATFSDPYYYASVLAIFSIITIAAVSCSRRNEPGVYVSKSYDSGMYTESNENYYIGRPVMSHHYHHHYDSQLSSSEKKPRTVSSYLSSILSNKSEQAVQKPSIKRTQSNESIVSISSSEGLELGKLKDSKKPSKTKERKAKRDKKTSPKQKSPNGTINGKK